MVDAGVLGNRCQEKGCFRKSSASMLRLIQFLLCSIGSSKPTENIALSGVLKCPAMVFLVSVLTECAKLALLSA